MHDPESCQISLDEFHHPRHRELAKLMQPLRFRRAEPFLTVARGESLADGLEIVAWIETLRNLSDILAQGFAVPKVGGAGQGIDLGTGIVDIILLSHGKTGLRQQVRQHVADYGTARVGNVERPSRVG